MNIIYKITLLLFVTLVVACSTTDTSMREQGHTESYIQGFHDGRHSGMKEEGNYFEHYIRDIERFKTDSEYKKELDSLLNPKFQMFKDVSILNN